MSAEQPDDRNRTNATSLFFSDHMNSCIFVFVLNDPQPRPAGCIERLSFPYVRTRVRPSVSPNTRLIFLAKVESQDLLVVAS